MVPVAEPAPEVAGQIIILTVSDASASAAWYGALLGWAQNGRFIQPDGHVHQVSLADPRSGLQMCLVSHQTGAGVFDEFRPGLDHLEFLVAQRGDLSTWAARLDGLGVPHSGVKEPPHTANAMLTFRDPDNIQLEFFWRGSS